MDELELRQRFVDTGIVRLDGAFSEAQAAAIRDVAWRYLERKSGVRLDDPNTKSTPRQMLGATIQGRR